MESFTERNSFASPSVIIDDAPDWLRKAFFDQILSEELCTESHVTHSKPVSARVLFNRLVLHLKLDVRPVNDHNLKDALKDCLSLCKWYEFYDSVELICEYLLNFDAQASSSFLKVFPYFRKRVNSFFRDARCGWSLDKNGRFQRLFDERISSLEKDVRLADQVPEAAKKHIQKARMHLDRYPFDFANSVKESVSAVESLGKTLIPGVSTLGKVAIELKKSIDFPTSMAGVIEKLYVFANAEPGIRHGGTVPDRIRRADAEFSYSIALAILIYLANFTGQD